MKTPFELRMDSIRVAMDLLQYQDAMNSRLPANGTALLPFTVDDLIATARKIDDFVSTKPGAAK